MLEHLRTDTRELQDGYARLDLWDTGRTAEYGKSILHYALWIGRGPTDTRGVLFEGEDFHPSPLHAVDSDATAGGLLAFFAAYGDPHSGADAPDEYTARQKETLHLTHEELTMWSLELEEAGEEAHTT